ncbi:uncharacterized protein LOC141595934 [Silene latifolia]|uniref:uncharacterized protein LOC141595934 n=1 Tax=Silene latifolia TaxID=37657 RepID=UPI003D7893B2
MESPSRALTLSPPRTRISTDSANSPEFEFWNTNCNNPGLITTSPLHSADELFSDGFILPLCSISKPGLCDFVGDTEPGSRDLVAEIEPGSRDLVAETEPGSRDLVAETEPGSSVGSSEPSAHITSNGGLILTASKRWKEIFKRGSSNSNSNGNEVDGNKIEKNDKKKEKDRKKNSGSGLGSGSTELNINIWPFSRSRSAGNNTTRSNKSASSNRKVSSAPCSRSNSSGESKSLRRAWPSSPGRAGVHLGRASPVWQVKRAGPGNRASPGGGGGKVASKVKVPVCIGYRQHLSCRSGESGVAVDGGGSSGSGVKGGGGNGSLFGFRGLFSKKLTDALTV